MAKKYSYASPGYDPLQDYLPPRKAGMAGGMVAYGIVVAVVGIGYLIFTLQHRKPDPAAAQAVTPVPSITATTTLDAWSVTGTAVYWAALTPTLTPSETPSITPTETTTPTETPVDAWSATGTAIYNALLTPSPTITLTRTPRPTSQPPTLRPSVVPSITRRAPTQQPHIEQVIITQPAPPPVRIIVTAPPVIIVQTVEVTRAITAVVPTATPLQPTSTSTLAIVWTATESPTATATATQTALPTATETLVPTETPTATQTEMSIEVTP